MWGKLLRHAPGRFSETGLAPKKEPERLRACFMGSLSSLQMWNFQGVTWNFTELAGVMI